MAAARRRAISGGALLMFGGMLALYQTTSLVLGPGPQNRQLQLAISAPLVDFADLSQPEIENVDLVLGTLAPQAASPASVALAPHTASLAPHIAAFQTVASSQAGPAPTTPVSTPAPLPVATPAPQPASHPLPILIKPIPPASPIVKPHDD